MQDNKKNIAFYIGNYRRSGGTERACISVANALQKFSEHNIFIISTNSSDEDSFFEIGDNVQIINLNIKSKKAYFLLLYRLITSLKKNKIDVIVAVEVMSLLFIFPSYFLKWLYNGKIKLVVWEHFNFTVNLGKSLRDWCRKLAAKYADSIIVLTKKDKNIWKNNLKIKNRIIAIYNPVAFDKQDEIYSINSKTIIAVGRLTYQKGFDRLVDIWFEFKIKYAHDSENWRLQIIGSGKDEEFLKQKIKNLNLTDSIELIANTNDIADYYKNAAFLVMTSRFEGMGLVLIEAQAFGLPLIAYDCLAGPSDIISKDSGFLIEDNNINDFVDKLNVLTQDITLRLSMSEAAKREVERFSSDTITERWKNLIDNLK